MQRWNDQRTTQSVPQPNEKAARLHDRAQLISVKCQSLTKIIRSDSNDFLFTAAAPDIMDFDPSSNTWDATIFRGRRLHMHTYYTYF